MDRISNARWVGFFNYTTGQILNKVMLEGSISRIIPQILNKVMLRGNISTIVPQ